MTSLCTNIQSTHYGLSKGIFTNNFVDLQMVPSSLQGEKDLARLCELRSDSTGAKNGVLFGKGEVEALQSIEQITIEDYFHNTPGFTGVPDKAAVYRSAYMEETNSFGSQTVHRAGDDAIVLQGENESVVKILKFYLLTVNHKYNYSHCDWCFLQNCSGCIRKHHKASTQ